MVFRDKRDMQDLKASLDNVVQKVLREYQGNLEKRVQKELEVEMAKLVDRVPGVAKVKLPSRRLQWRLKEEQKVTKVRESISYLQLNFYTT